MPRRREVAKRVILPDPKFHDRLVAKFVNALMIGGKKSTAESIVYGAFDLIKERAGDEPVEVFKKAIENVRPVVEVKSRRVGGSTYRFRLKFGPSVAMPWQSVGSLGLPAAVVKRPWRSALLLSLWMQPGTVVPRLRNVKTLIVWPKLIKPSLIIAGRRRIYCCGSQSIT